MTTIDAGARRDHDDAPSGGARPPSLRGLLLNLDRLPERLAAIVAATDGVAQGRSGPARIAVLADPALARGLLTRSSGVGQGRGIAALRLTLGQGLLTSSGELHKRQRRLVQPAFHPARLARYAHDAVRAAAERSASWQDGQQFDLAAQMSSLTLDVVARTLFGADVRGEAGDVAVAQHELLELFPRFLRPTGLITARWPTPLRRRLRRNVAKLDAVVEHVVAARRAAAARGERTDHGDVASILLEARDPDTGEGMPAQLVRDEVLTLLLAGHETTAVALSWAWFELARHPQVRASLDAELARATSRSALREGDWDALPFTRAVVAETLRLHPPAYVMGRVAREDLDLGGHRIRRGTVCIVSPYALHRDQRSWGADVLAWRPERWLDSEGRFDEAAPGQPRGAYLPFGAGSRVCIGAAFATMEATLILATLASSWHAEIAEGFDPGMHPAVTLRPRHGVPATLHRHPAAR